MPRLKRLAAGAAFSISALAFAGSSSATALLVNTGWQYDQINTANAASQDSPLTFTVASGQSDLFSLSDGFKTGDVYKVVVDGLITAITTKSLYATPFNNNLGPAAADFAADWLNASFAHLQLSFGPGAYSLVVYGNGGGGIPAGVGERLDNGAISLPVPEPATWLTMLVGFGAMGTVMRNNRRRQTLTAV